MKTSKKITIAALSAATALVGATGAVSSFAWFAANGSVEANSMSIKALSTTAFLQIKNSEQTWGDESHKSAAASVKEATLNPTHIFKSLTVKTGDEADVVEAYDGGATYKWASANSNEVTSSQKDGHYTDVTTTADPANIKNAATQYTLINTFDLRLRPNADGAEQPKAGALSASVSFDTNTSTEAIKKSISVFIAVGDNRQLFTNDGTNFTKSVGAEKLADSMNHTAISAKIYVFFDGENENCFTNAVKVDAAYSVKVTFTVGDAPQA